MQILHVVHQYLPDFMGGTEHYTQTLVNGLRTHGFKSGIFYRRSASGTGLTKRQDDAADVWSVWDGKITPSRRFLATFGSPFVTRAFEDVLISFKPDLVHIQHMMGLPFALLRILQRHRVPFVVTLHDYWWVCANAQLVTNYDQTLCHGPHAYVNCARCALARANHSGSWFAIPALIPLLSVRNHLLRRFLRQAVSMIAPSEFVRRWYVEHGVSAEKIRVIPHGVTSPSRLDRHTDDAVVRFAYVGGLSWQKGVHIVLDAFRSLKHTDGLSAELLIVGDETFDPAYTKYLHSLATPNVRFLGRLPHAEVWSTLAQVDVLLVPSLWYETFCFVAHEAFAAGIPVVVSDLGALSEAIRPGVDGVRVKPGDLGAWREALERLLSSPALLAKLTSNVRSPFSLPFHVQEVIALYQKSCIE